MSTRPGFMGMSLMRELFKIEAQKLLLWFMIRELLLQSRYISGIDQKLGVFF